MKIDLSERETEILKTLISEKVDAQFPRLAEWIALEKKICEMEKLPMKTEKYEKVFGRR
jgi:hypothetical protein